MVQLVLPHSSRTTAPKPTYIVAGQFPEAGRFRLRVGRNHTHKSGEEFVLASERLAPQYTLVPTRRRSAHTRLAPSLATWTFRLRRAIRKT